VPPSPAAVAHDAVAPALDRSPLPRGLCVQTPVHGRLHPASRVPRRTLQPDHGLPPTARGWRLRAQRRQRDAARIERTPPRHGRHTSRPHVRLSLRPLRERLAMSLPTGIRRRDAATKRRPAPVRRRGPQPSVVGPSGRGLIRCWAAPNSEQPLRQRESSSEMGSFGPFRGDCRRTRRNVLRRPASASGMLASGRIAARRAATAWPRGSTETRQSLTPTPQRTPTRWWS
jgi:hypothetical protein